MAPEEVLGALDPALTSALKRQGFTELTPVQVAILSPALAGRDLRITSQTGSGKTVAIGLALRDVMLSGPASPPPKGTALPRALVIAPTRELALQVEQELTWLYSATPARVASATGGASLYQERRRLGLGPAAVVGTPGRLLDHLTRGTIDPAAVAAIVFDEADRMLDLGFKDELDAILAKLPSKRSTHLVSATFPKDVRALADRVQTDAAHVQGSRLGVANTDIEHVIHLVQPRQRLDAMINLLLSDGASRTLIFVRTRADVGDLAAALGQAGFRAAALSGDMDQGARNRALQSFKQQEASILVATDVAARGIDVQDITRVIHADPPTDADSYTHRSGRTGRAGRRGVSSLLVAPRGVRKVERLLEQARVKALVRPVPTAEELRDQRDQTVYEELTAESGSPLSPRIERLAQRLVDAGDATRTVARLLQRSQIFGAAEPRDIEPERTSGPERRGAARRTSGANEGFVDFHVNWGADRGADTRRLLALVCRRGQIRGSDVGRIDIDRRSSRVGVAASVAAQFARAVARPDPRDPKISIRREVAASRRAPPHASKAPSMVTKIKKGRPKQLGGTLPGARTRPRGGR